MTAFAPLTELLDAPQIETLRAAVDRILPADDAPSGWEAGLGGFFALLLARESRFLLPTLSGLDALDAEARAAGGASFAALTPDAQDALLSRVEAGEVRAEWPLDAADFFHRLVSQAMEGFYADPSNGGNKDGAGWKMVGYRVTA